MPRVTAGTVLKLLLASLAVGAAMAFLGLSPNDLLRYASSFTREAFASAASWAGAAVTYVLVGAVIVVPVWLIATLFRSFRR